MVQAAHFAHTILIIVIYFVLSVTSIGAKDFHLIPVEDWSACECGALQVFSLGSIHSGLALLHQRDLFREEATFLQFGGVEQPFAFVFDDPESGLIIDSSELGTDIKGVIHASQIDGRSAIDFGVTMESAAEIHVIDSCFVFLSAALNLSLKPRLVLHRYASTRIAAQNGCPRIEHSLLQSAFVNWEILERPKGIGDVVVMGSEIEDDEAEHVVIFSMRKVNSLPPNVALSLRHNLASSSSSASSVTFESHNSVTFDLTFPRPAPVQPQCPSCASTDSAASWHTHSASDAPILVREQALGKRCPVRFEKSRAVTFGRTFSELTASVQGQITTRVVSWYSMLSEDGEGGVEEMVEKRSEERGHNTLGRTIVSPPSSSSSSSPSASASASATAAAAAAASSSSSPSSCAEADVFFAEEYLPSRECLEAGGRSESEERMQPCVDALERRLLRRQLESGGECEGVKAAGFSNYGLGSTLHYLLVQLHRASTRDQRISFVGEWVYGGCAAKDFSCAFEPWSTCSFPRGYAIDPDYPRFAPQSQSPDSVFEACAGGQQNALFHYASVLASFLWRPNAEMKRAAQEARLRMKLPERYIGVHVRHGDFCIASKVVEEESKECFSVLAYAEAVTKMASLYGVRHVFLASDNQESIEMLRDLCPDLKFYWQSDVDRAFLAATVEDFDKEELWVESKLFKSNAERRLEHLTEIMVDLILLLDSMGFVGQFSSNISRLVVEVNSRRKKRIMPWISLDLPFCYSGGRGFRYKLEDGTWETPGGKTENTSFFYC